MSIAQLFHSKMDIVLLLKERFDKKSSMRRSNLNAFPDNAEIYSALFSSGALDKKLQISANGS